MPEWKNVHGDCTIELEEDLELCGLSLKEGDEVTVHFIASGFYQPMSQYGGPGNLGWPEEVSDERYACRVTVNGHVYTDAAVLEAAESHFRSEIYDADLPEDQSRKWDE